MRIAYFHTDHPNAVLIRYVGDSTLAVQFPHRNAKSTQRNYTRTQPSILRNIGSVSGSARQVYQQQVLAGPPNVYDQLASVPRNLEQVRNVRKMIRNRNCLTHDGLYNLHKWAFDNDDFVRHITTYPNLIVVMYDTAIMRVFHDTLDSGKLQQLTYDTTFMLGDFYVSILLFRETELDESPVVPLAYMIHETKTKYTHLVFWLHMHEALGDLPFDNVIIITDQEAAITQSIATIMP